MSNIYTDIQKKHIPAVALVSSIKRLFLRKGNSMSDVRDTYIGQVVA